MASRKKTFKIIGILFVLIIAVLACYTVWFSQHYKEILKTKITAWVANATDSAYHVSIQDINVNIFTRYVNAKGVKLWPDSARIVQLRQRGRHRSATYTVYIPGIQATGIKWVELVHDKELNCGQLTIVQPRLMILPLRDDSVKVTDTSNKKKTIIQRLHADHIYIDGPEVVFNASSKDQFTCNVKGGKIRLHDWSFDRNVFKDTTSFFYAKSGTISLGTFTYTAPGNLYKIISSGVEFTSEKQNLVLKNILIAPILDKEAYFEKIGVQKEIYNVQLPLVEFKDLNWKRIIEEKMLYASSMNLQNPVFDVYLSRYPPPNTQSKVGQFPQQLLLKMGLRVYIPKVYISGAVAKYTELNRKTGKAGVVIFNNIHGTCTNLTNIDSIIEKNPHCIAKLSGAYDHKSPAVATFDFLLSDKKGFFTVDGTLADINTNQISPAAEALALAKIDNVYVSKYTVHVAGNEDHAAGTFTLLYNDLKVNIEEMHNGSSNEKHFTTFMTNHVYIFTDNPMPNDKVRTVSTSLDRDRVRSFFNLIWANMYRGVLQTAVKDEKLAKNIADNPNSKKSKRRLIKSFFKSIFRKKSK